ncbi:mechanosensitive ion channel family protein [Fulvivirga ligni]|uniref:mechanosensitive ion channel family protein n=1 Tax=Fulvivirga ligni TaxID=2904246 RepID=UPI001F3FD287|nr:mechanosensitive ion channel domain-containing protein [Fulvivirga ligni]UII21102.1 mechanosensitive ion channel [Fulvivirga ligni]
MEYLEQAKTFLATRGVEVGLMIIKAALILFIGLQVVKFLSRTFAKFMDNRNVDASLKPFLKNLFHNLLLVLLILSVLATLGIEMTSFVAIIGAAGLAIGLALQGTLQNFAGGVIILTLKPFRVGDYIDGGGVAGTVKEIQIFQTILATPDNVRIVVPNGQLSNDSIKNYSANDTRRVDLVFGIGYDDDIKKAKEILENMVKNDARVLEDPAPSVTVASLGDSSVNFNVRPWVNRADYWAVYWDFQENVKLEFDANGISIPFPQRDVHIYNEK